MDATELHDRRLNGKEVLAPPKGWFFLPDRRWKKCQTVNAERRNIFYSSAIYRRDQGYKYIFRCNAVEKVERRWLLDRWWKSRIVRYVLDGKTSGWIYWPGRGRQESKRLPDQALWDQKIWNDMSEAPKRREKPKVGYRKTEARLCHEECA